jgi:hypothetical protein
VCCALISIDFNAKALLLLEFIEAAPSDGKLGILQTSIFALWFANRQLYSIFDIQGHDGIGWRFPLESVNGGFFDSRGEFVKESTS